MAEKEKLDLTSSLRIRHELNKAIDAINGANKILEQREGKGKPIQLFGKEVNKEALEREKTKINEAIQLINEEIKENLRKEMKRVYSGRISGKGYAHLLDKLKVTIDVVGKNLTDLKGDLQIISFIQIIAKRLALKLIEEAKKAHNREVRNDLLDVIKVAIETLAESSIILKSPLH